MGNRQGNFKLLNLSSENGLVILHKSNGGNVFWEPKKEEIIDMYISKKMSMREIAEKYNCNPSTISSHIKAWGIEPRKERYNSIYSVNQHFFLFN